VLDGGANLFPSTTCVSDLNVTTRATNQINGRSVIIAAQCCEPTDGNHKPFSLKEEHPASAPIRLAELLAQASS
jgi:hypothetical protein